MELDKTMEIGFSDLFFLLQYFQDISNYGRGLIFSSASKQIEGTKMKGQSSLSEFIRILQNDSDVQWNITGLVEWSSLHSITVQSAKKCG